MKRHSADFWHTKVNEFEASGLEQQVFCEQHDLRLGTFQNWVYKLRGKKPTPLLRVHSSSSESLGVELTLRRGMTLRFRGDVPPSYIAKLVRELEA